MRIRDGTDGNPPRDIDDLPLDDDCRVVPKLTPAIPVSFVSTETLKAAKQPPG